MSSFALIGDSQAVGVQPRLEELLSVAFADPKVGWTTLRIRRDGPFERALSSGASTILLVTGGNDDPLNVTALRDMIALAQAAGKALIVVGPVFALTDDAARHDRARAALQAALQGTSARWIDAYPLTRDLANAANVHLGASARRRYAERIAAKVAGGSGSGGVLLAGAVAFALAYALARTA